MPFTYILLSSTVHTFLTSRDRCIKPNKLKEVGHFDEDFVKAQVKCNGIPDTIRIRKYGFPVRLPYKTFVER